MANYGKISAAKKRCYVIYRHALAHGILRRPDVCERCHARPGKNRAGHSKIHGHHYMGYDHPVDVQWLCVACHKVETPFAFAESNGQHTQPHRRPRLERHGSAKLDCDKVREIRSAVGLSQQDLATLYGVHQTTILRILRGRNWIGV